MNRSGRVLGLVALLLLTTWAPTLRSLAHADDAPPQLPAYFSSSHADPAKPTWPDPTGASGVWATPAGDGKGDVPSALAITDLYGPEMGTIGYPDFQIHPGQRITG